MDIKLGKEIKNGDFDIITYSVSSNFNQLIATKSSKKEEGLNYYKNREKQFLLKDYILML